MELIKCRIDQNIFCCPMILNNPTVTGELCRAGNGEIDESNVKQVYDAIGNDKSNNYILDLNGVVKFPQTEQHYNELLNLNNVVLCFEKGFFDDPSNRCFKISDMTILEGKSEYIVYKRDKVNQEFESYINKYNNNENEIIKMIHSQIYARFFKEEIYQNNHKYGEGTNELKYLESSNVYVNRYINVKAIFLKPDYLALVISDLRRLITTSFDGDFCLLGVSNNGIILSRLLADQLNKKIEVLSINHLGPRYCLDDGQESVQQLRNKKFVLISDVICLGGEYRLAKGVLNVMNSHLLGAVCVVKIRDVYRKVRRQDKIMALIDDINAYEIDGEKIDYKICVDCD